LCTVIWAVLRFVWPRASWLARAWFWTICGSYLVLGLPIVATAIIDRLPSVPPVDAASVREVDTLVIFDGDNRLGRVDEALRVYAAAQPEAVFVLGQVWILDTLVAAGLPPDRLRCDGSSPTTLAQMDWVRRRMTARPGERTAVIASRLQMPRVAALTRTAGLRLKLIPSPIDSEPPTTGVWRFAPMYTALRASRDALYEHAALAYYRWQGWIGLSWAIMLSTVS
jgi:uncharacterized SAM-binding protein YcdF (DUF218 family)